MPGAERGMDEEPAKLPLIFQLEPAVFTVM